MQYYFWIIICLFFQACQPLPHPARVEKEYNLAKTKLLAKYPIDQVGTSIPYPILSNLDTLLAFAKSYQALPVNEEKKQAFNILQNQLEKDIMLYENIIYEAKKPTFYTIPNTKSIDLKEVSKLYQIAIKQVSSTDLLVLDTAIQQSIQNYLFIANSIPEVEEKENALLSIKDYIAFCKSLRHNAIIN